MSRSWMTAIRNTVKERAVFSHKLFCGICAGAILWSVVLGTANAQETQVTQPGMMPNGDIAQGNIGADDAVANTTQGEHP